MGAVFAPTRFSLVRISIRDLVADGKSLVRNSGVRGGGQNRILKNCRALTKIAYNSLTSGESWLICPQEEGNIGRDWLKRSWLFRPEGGAKQHLYDKSVRQSNQTAVICWFQTAFGSEVIQFAGPQLGLSLELGSQFPFREYKIPPPPKSPKMTQELQFGPTPVLSWKLLNRDD